MNFLKGKGEPDYNLAITEITKAGTVFDSNDSDNDPLFDEAVQVVIQAGKASTSYLQRRLRVGYSRAARLIDLMEEAGVVGQGEGAKPREILIEEWPPGGNLKQGMPTAQDDYDEAFKNNKPIVEEEQEEAPDWSPKVDDAWFDENEKNAKNKDEDYGV